MGHFLLTIDGGTTNTRLFLLKEDGELMGMFSQSIGARDILQKQDRNL